MELDLTSLEAKPNCSIYLLPYLNTHDGVIKDAARYTELDVIIGRSILFWTLLDVVGPSMPPHTLPSANQQQSTLQTRTATDAAGELNQRETTFNTLCPSSDRRNLLQQAPSVLDFSNPYSPVTNDSTPPPRRHSFTRRLLHLHDGASDFGPSSMARKRSASGRRKPQTSSDMSNQSVIGQVHNNSAGAETSTQKTGLGPRPVGGHGKLGTFSGVFVPTSLNVLSILMFLRFGFVLGQGGVLGIMGKSLYLPWGQ